MVSSWIYLTVGVIVSLIALGAVAINTALKSEWILTDQSGTLTKPVECRSVPHPSDELIVKERTWISVTKIDSRQIIGECTIVTPELISKLPKLEMAFKGADGCKDRTEVCEVSYGVSVERCIGYLCTSDSNDYELSLLSEEASTLAKEIRLTKNGDASFGTVVYNDKFYALGLLTTDADTGAQVKSGFVEPIDYKPVSLKKGETITYTLMIKTYATYGKPAEIDLQATASARDSGLGLTFEPSHLVVPERSESTAKLIITADENARDGKYPIAVSVAINNGNGGFIPACHHGSSCAVVQIGDSDWEIRTYGSDSFASIGGKKAPEWLRVKIETDKDVYSKGESIEIKTYIINDSEDKIVLDKDVRLIIQVLGASGSLYGIDSSIFDGKPIVLEPKSRTILVRPFYWDQQTFISWVASHNVDLGTYTLTMDFAGYQGHVFYGQKKIRILE